MRNPAELNLAVFRDASVVADYASDAWRCDGERLLFQDLADCVRGGALLDIGIGLGRTTSLLRLFVDRYVGIDYSPEMVATARQRHPGADLRLGDARRIEFAESEFDAVVFSFNGIDNLGHADRAVVFAEIRRVLRPGGWLCYSTLNKDGPQSPARPWRSLPRLTRSPLSWARLALTALRRLRAVGNWLRTRRLEEDHGDWSLETLDAHDYRLLNHHISVPAARRELDEAGFELVRMVGPNGDNIPAGQRYDVSSTVFVLARKRGAA